MAAERGERLPEQFRAAVRSLREAAPRPEVALSETPGPLRLAPHSHALRGEVLDDAGDELAGGRLVLLHDPSGCETWQGSMRLVSWVRAELEPEIAEDPLLLDVAWSWLSEALHDCGATHRARAGTVTRAVSQRFGEGFGAGSGSSAGGGAGREPGARARRSETATIEIRASWTPVGHDLGPHVLAWCQLLCTTGGLPPAPPPAAGSDLAGSWFHRMESGLALPQL